MRRRRVLFLPLLAAACLSAVTASTAAADGPAPVQGAGCSGYSCWAQIHVTVTTYNGNSGPSSTAPAPPPPQCWYGPPTYTAQQMLQLLQNNSTGAPGAPPNLYKGWDPAKIQQLASENAQGLWYTADADPNNPAGVKCIENTLPSTFIWVPQGQDVPQPGVAPGDLAQYAFSALKVTAPYISLNPANQSIVNLPTFVKIVPPPPGAPQAAAHLAANGQIWATASVNTGNGVQSVTVAAFPQKINITVSGGTSGAAPATVYTAGCGPKGSRESTKAMSQATVKTRPDCGVVFQQPSPARPFTLSVTQSWAPTAYDGGFVPGKRGNLLPAADQGLLQSPPASQQVPVKEIQSLNN
jgi:hypothetical protein